MAQNRLSLRCRRCGETVVIARLSAGEDVWSPSRVPTQEYERWLDTHTRCGGSAEDYGLNVDLVGEDGFWLINVPTER